MSGARRRSPSSTLLTLPARGVTPQALRRRLLEAQRADWDFTQGRIFGSMCTQPVPAAVVAPQHFVTANLGNPGLAPGTARLEEEVIAILRHLFHAPTFGAAGWVLSGGTEANITALWMARNASGGSEVVLPVSAHFSFLKALDLLRLRPRWVPVDRFGRARLDRIGSSLSRRTAALVGIAGSTELGAVDPIAEMSRLAQDRGIPLHVDAAFGGFVLPWLPPPAGGSDRRFDLELPGVTSLTVDPHKMGMAPVPAGVLLVRHREQAGSIAVPSPYLTAPQTSGLLGTRASSSVAGTYAALTGLGQEGYRRNVERCMQMTEQLRVGAQELGLRPVAPPTMNIVAFHHVNPLAVQNWMLTRGWDVSAVKHPSALRFVVMPHATARTIEALLGELGRALRRFPARG